MNGLRFKQGDMAIFAVSRSSDSVRFVGQVVTVQMVGPFPNGYKIRNHRGKTFETNRCDYIVMPNPTQGITCDDYQLRKIDPPPEPESLTRQHECEEPA